MKASLLFPLLSTPYPAALKCLADFVAVPKDWKDLLLYFLVRPDFLCFLPHSLPLLTLPVSLNFPHPPLSLLRANVKNLVLADRIVPDFYLPVLPVG